MTVDEIEHRFTYHAPSGDQQARYVTIREHAKAFALLLNLACPEGREKSLAFTGLQETVMWANASIACERDNNVEGRDTYAVASKPLDPRR